MLEENSKETTKHLEGNAREKNLEDENVDENKENITYAHFWIFSL